MKLSQAKEYLPIIQAAAEGKTVQSFDEGIWRDWPLEEDCWFMSPASLYRVKPEPRLRPWKPEEVPVGALLRLTAKTCDRFLIVGFDLGRIKYGQWHDLPDEMLRHYEHSLDGGNTWKPCGVEEIP
jgi:hypothetical protein